MREIRFVGRFKRDYKREKSGRHGKTLDAALMDVVRLHESLFLCCCDKTQLKALRHHNDNISL
jgi:hypothetical protein